MGLLCLRVIRFFHRYYSPAPGEGTIGRVVEYIDYFSYTLYSLVLVVPIYSLLLGEN